MLAWLADISTAQDYYPFGMRMAQRHKEVGDSVYRFGFNGIEKVNEVAGIGNHYTALFGEYDPRVVTRWNTDPKPTVGVSPYAMFGGNPIWYSDRLLDTWTVATDADTKKDVQGIPTNSKNQQYVNIGQDGKVSMNFGNMDKKSINKLLKKDDGLSLVNDLVNAKEDYYYSTSPDFQSRG